MRCSESMAIREAAEAEAVAAKEEAFAARREALAAKREAVAMCDAEMAQRFAEADAAKVCLSLYLGCGIHSSCVHCLAEPRHTEIHSSSSTTPPLLELALEF